MRPRQFFYSLILLVCLALSIALFYVYDVVKCSAHYRVENYNKAFPSCEKAAKQGNEMAQVILATMYAGGLGVTQDDETAIKWMQATSEPGYERAETTLGFMYQYGIWKVKSNHKTAAKWYQKAAEHGDGIAQFALAAMYESGQGVPQDKKRAAKLYQKAAEHEIAAAQFGLGRLYEEGQGVPQDKKEAAKLYQKAANQGDGPAQSALGKMYEDGQGVIADPQESFIWFSLAVFQKIYDAEDNRDRVKKKLTNSELREAEEEVKRRQAAIEKKQQSYSDDIGIFQLIALFFKR